MPDVCLTRPTTEMWVASTAYDQFTQVLARSDTLINWIYCLTPPGCCDDDHTTEAHTAPFRETPEDCT